MLSHILYFVSCLCLSISCILLAVRVGKLEDIVVQHRQDIDHLEDVLFIYYLDFVGLSKYKSKSYSKKQKHYGK